MKKILDKLASVAHSLRPTSKFQRWQTLTEKVQGFFYFEAAGIWDALLEYQSYAEINGDIAEIGVFEGKFAALAALHLKQQETLVLIDPVLLPQTKDLVHNIVAPNRVSWHALRSSKLAGTAMSQEYARRFRWVHVDGEHSAEAVCNDLGLAKLWLADDGIISIDDFMNPAYPQVTAATFEFLTHHRHEFNLFLCGFNKAYVCRPMASPTYLGMIRDQLSSALSVRGIGNVTIFKTALPSEMNCFGITPRFQNFDYYGLDSNPSIIAI